MHPRQLIGLVLFALAIAVAIAIAVYFWKQKKHSVTAKKTAAAVVRPNPDSCGHREKPTNDPASASATMVAGDDDDMAYQAADSPPGMSSSGPAPPERCPDDAAIRMPQTAKLENLLPNSLRAAKDRVRERAASGSNSAPEHWGALAPTKDGFRKFVKSGAQAYPGASDQVKDPTGRVTSAEPWFRMPTTSMSKKIHPFNESSTRVDILHDAIPDDVEDPFACSSGAVRRV